VANGGVGNQAFDVVLCKRQVVGKCASLFIRAQKRVGANMKMDKLLVILIYLLVTQCTSALTGVVDFDTDNIVVYSVDKDGLYQYDQSTANTTKIADLKEVFIDNSLTFIDDSVVIIGYRGEAINEARDKITGELLECPCSSTDSLIVQGIVGSYKYDRYTLYRQTFQAINIKTHNSWVHKTIDYKHKEMDTLTVTKTLYNSRGDVFSSNDTIYRCNGISYSSDGLRFCDSERFYSESNVVNDKLVFSRKGNLYLRENGKEILLLEFDGHFDPKFGSGYFQPTLALDGEKVTFRYLAGFLKSGSGLFELDLKTMGKKEIMKDDFFRPIYSPDGRYLLLGKYQRQDKSKGTWINDIYILDLKTSKTKKIAEGDLFTWKK